MPALFKQRCYRCKQNYVIISRRLGLPICYECQKDELKKEIKDPKMKELFDIPEEFYRENSFLRNVKVSYIRFGKLSEKQIEAFKKTVEKLKSGTKAKGPSYGYGS